MAHMCKECGCTCKRCTATDHDIQLHLEIENLEQRLLERENHIVTMETNFLNEANKFPSGELVAVREELLTWQDKYRRLYEAHRRVQRVNQGLEDKLLKLVDVCETEKNTLTKDVATLSHRLAEANYAVKKLTEDNERYKNDVSLAIQFLQCKQSNFVVHRFDTLPPEVQTQVANYMTVKKKPEERKTVSEVKSIKVPMPTFPPTAMVYSVPKSPESQRKLEPDDVEASPVDIVSAAIMAKVLEERQRERAQAKHCDTCTCAKNLQIVYDIAHFSVGTQTGEYKEQSCLRCNESLQISHGGMKIVQNMEKTPKVVPIYPLEGIETTQVSQAPNIVKVQPNNFLVENETKSKSAHSSTSNLNSQQHSPKTNSINPNDRVISSEISMYCDMKLDKANEKTAQFYGSVDEKPNSETNVGKIVAKPNSTGHPKGPRYCSMRVHSTTKNILLDNTHNNVAPVLYTRTHKRSEETALTHESSNPTSRSSSDYKINSMESEMSAHNQQRVAEWIQNNLENELSSPEHSRSENLSDRNDVILDKVKYAEMEENVKRFLFGMDEFKKTVDIGKKKYQNYIVGEMSGSDPANDAACSFKTNN